jgi:hypothetical protein
MTMSAALAEAAYYRFVFWSGMIVPPPAGKLTSEHTLFGANYETGRGIRLHRPPFDRFITELISPADYTNTRQLGTAMRDSGIEAFEYRSARDPEQGLNVALFTPSAFASHGPEWQQAWICETRAEQVSFFNMESGSTGYELDRFLVDGRLPVPAA